jgi:hypothetical protein
MSVILRRLPFSEREDIAFVRGERIRVKAYQIIIWVSLSSRRAITWQPGTLSFPAIVDPGHNHNFSIQEEHLIRWAGLRPDALPILDRIRQGGRRIPLQVVDLWIHYNEPGQRDRLANRTPYRLKLLTGVAVYPSGAGFPPLPLLGLRALATNNLILTIDGKRRQVNLRTARKWWPW